MCRLLKTVTGSSQAWTRNVGGAFFVSFPAGGVSNAFDIPVFTEAFLRPLFARGIGPFRWMALSNDPDDIRKIDDLLLMLFGDNHIVSNWGTGLTPDDPTIVLDEMYTRKIPRAAARLELNLLDRLRVPTDCRCQSA